MASAGASCRPVFAWIISGIGYELRKFQVNGTERGSRMSSEAQGNGGPWRRGSESANGEQLATALGWFSIGLGLAELVAPGKLAELIGVRDQQRSRTLLRMYGAREIGAGIGILSQPQSAAWLWSRVGGDIVDLSSLGAALNSRRTDRAKAGAATAAVLAVTALDVYCAQQLSRSSNGEKTNKSSSVPVTHTTIIDRSPEEIYQFWHDLSHLPRFMKDLESVEVRGDGRSHWTAIGPAGKRVEWDAETIEDVPNSRIAWRSLPGSDVHNTGSVEFQRATGGRGTVVKVQLEYAPPAGVVGATVAKLFRAEPGQQVENSLRALKQVLETGEVVKSDASVHRGMHPGRPSTQAASA
jgi:uncharacterized membrane protein